MVRNSIADYFSEEDQEYLRSIGRRFYQALISDRKTADMGAAVGHYLTCRAQFMNITGSFGLVNNRLIQSENSLIIPFYTDDVLVILRLEAGGKEKVHLIPHTPGEIITDQTILDLFDLQGTAIDLEREIADIQLDRIVVPRLGGLRDIASLLAEINAKQGQNEGLFLLRILTAQLCHSVGNSAVAAKNLLPEVYEVTSQFVKFLNGPLFSRSVFMSRILARNFPKLVGEPGLLDRLWNDTIALAEVHIPGSSIVNEIRRTSHHSISSRTLELARAYEEFLTTGNHDRLLMLGFYISSADKRAGSRSTVLDLVRRIVSDLERLFSEEGIVSNLKSWKKSYVQALYSCEAGSTLQEEHSQLISKGISSANRWSYYHHLRIIRKKVSQLTKPEEIARSFLSDLEVFASYKPDEKGCDSERLIREITISMNCFLEKIADEYQQELFLLVDKVMEAYERGNFHCLFDLVHEVRAWLSGLIKQNSFKERRYFLLHLDCILEEIGYLALRHVATEIETGTDGLEECLLVIRKCVLNLKFSGIHSQELHDLSAMLIDCPRPAEELSNILKAIMSTYHKILSRIIGPYEKMKDRLKFGKEELRLMLANLQRYLHDLNSMVSFCDLAITSLEKKGRQPSGRTQTDNDSQAPIGQGEKTIRHISHKGDGQTVTDWCNGFCLRDLYGGKGSGLFYISSLGIPTCDGFIVPTTVARAGMHMSQRETLEKELLRHVHILEKDLEQVSGQSSRLGDPKSPLLLSVRGGSVFSMPGILNTIVFLGINDMIVETLAEDDPWKAYDSYRRFLASYAWASWGFDIENYGLVEEAKKQCRVRYKQELPWEAMEEVAEVSKSILRRKGYGRELDEILENPEKQLFKAVQSVFSSWNSVTAIRYRTMKGLCDSWHTAAIVQTMTFGNRRNENITPGMDEREVSLTGVIPRTRLTDRTIRELEGEIKFSAAGDDLVSGMTSSSSIRSIEELRELTPMLERELSHHASRLRRFMGTDQEIEFTVDRGNLRVLQSRTAETAVDVSPTCFVDPGEPIARGLGIRGGGFRGAAAFDEDDLVFLSGTRILDQDDVDGIVMIVENPTPDDIPLIISADAVLTARGGSTSHAAIAVNSVDEKKFYGVMSIEGLRVDKERKQAVFVDENGNIKGQVKSGSIISLHGISGEIYLGSRPLERGG